MDDSRGRLQYSPDEAARIRRLLAVIVSGDACPACFYELEMLLDKDHLDKFSVPELKVLVDSTLKQKVKR